MEEQYSDRIEQYNLGLLSGTELERFEAEMLADPKLAEAVYEHRIAWEIGELLAEENLRAQIRERFDAPPPPPQTVKKKKIWNNTLLALLALFGTAGFLFLLNRQNARPEPAKSMPTPEISPPKTPPEPAPQPPGPAARPQAPMAQKRPQPTMRALALASYRVPEGLSGIRGGNDNENLSLAATAFSEKDYARVLELLADLPENERQEALSLRAHAHFGAKNFADATRDFSELEKGGVYRREAQWFAALAYLAAYPTDKKKVLEMLGKIKQDSKHPYRTNAEKLSRAMLE